jgi:translation initiation factor 4A
MSQNLEPENTTNSNDVTISEATNTSENNNSALGDSVVNAIYNTWESLEISDELLRGIFAYGFESPSPIQSKAIKPIMLGRDIIAQAQSGTGKTATFSIGALSRVNTKENCNQVLIMAPTHELAQQITSVINNLSNNVLHEEINCEKNHKKANEYNIP